MMRKTLSTWSAVATVAALAASAQATAVNGSLLIEDKGPPDPLAHWQVANNLVDIQPPLRPALAEAIVVIQGGSEKPQPLSITPTLTINDSRFEPAAIVIRPNTAVTISNSESTQHLLDAQGAFNGLRIDPRDTAQRIFKKVGVYTVRCSEFPHIVATVVVSNAYAATTVAGNGSFRFNALSPGSYTLGVIRDGAWVHRQPVSIVGARTRLEIKLSSWRGVE
ncbi:MAG: hypothetical protein H6707_06335 [Deltaproteobacteria bacterium]|nr:hypothetical protein [Deltaproteobacteria bacterium]